uniref:Uncharacterized protein n=1 Tax=Setaria italica TaxID=4555 RepID=K3XU59_SETIT
MTHRPVHADLGTYPGRHFYFSMQPRSALKNLFDQSEILPGEAFRRAWCSRSQGSGRGRGEQLKYRSVNS